MRFRTTLLLGLVFLALGAYIYFVEFEKAEQEARKKTVFDFRQEDVTAVTLTYPDKEIVLELVAGTWMLKKPIETKADEPTVKNLIRAVQDAEVKKEIEDPGENLERFGLDDPEARVQLKLKDGKELPVIVVGRTTPVGYNAYIQRAGEKTVLMTTSAFHAGMKKEVKDLRDKQILSFSEEQATKVVVERATDRVTLEKKNGSWKITEPAEYATDSSVVQSLLSTLRTGRAADFATDAPVDLGEYGLDQPQTTITVWLGDTELLQLLFGKQDEKNQYFAKVGSRPTVYLVSEWFYRDASKTVNDLRDKTLLAFEKDAAQKVEVRAEDGSTFVLEKNAEGKWMLDGADASAQATRIDQFLTDLRDLKGYEILSDSTTDEPKYGLDSPLLRIAVHGADKPIGVVRAAKFAAEDETEREEWAAVSDAQPTIFKVREYILNRVKKQRADFLPPTPSPTPVT